MNKSLVLKTAVCCLLLLAGMAELLHAQGFRRAFNPQGSFCRGLLVQSNGDIIMTGGIRTDGRIFLQRVDAAGYLVWTNHLDRAGAHGRALCNTSDGGFAVLAESFPDGGQLKNILLKFSAGGDLQWETVLNNPNLNNKFRDLVATSDGGLALVSDTRVQTPQVEQEVLFVKLDGSGNQLWTATLGFAGANEIVSRLVQLPDGDLVAAGERRPIGQTESDYFLIRTNSQGDLLWKQWYDKPGYQNAKDLLATPNGELTIIGETYQLNPARQTILKTDGSGNEIWYRDAAVLTQEPFGGYQSLVNCFTGDAGGNLYVAAYDSARVALTKYDPAGHALWNKVSNVSDIPYAVSLTPDGYFAIAGETEVPGLATLMKIDADGNYLNFFNQLSGRVFLDENDDCLYDPAENAYLNFVVEARNQFGESYYKTVRQDGQWSMAVSEGIFQVFARPVGSPAHFWTICDTPTVNITGINQAYTAPDIGVDVEVLCPFMEVQLSAGLMRRCTSSYYSVYYCNYGTQTAEDAYVLVVPDPLQSYEFSSIPLVGGIGDTLRFNVGDVEPGDCGTFNIRFLLSCEAQNGQTICAEAYIFPDTLCNLEAPNWDGSDLSISGACNGGTVQFTVLNKGSGDMAAAVEYVIIEDQIMLAEGSIQLAASEDTVITLNSADGYSYYMIADQTAGHPAPGQPSAAIDQCNGGSGQSLHLLLPADDEAPAVDIFCNEVVGSFDPNDKMGFPLGWKDEHYLEPGREIEYRVRFQNTGNDTAFLVIIRDTLSDVFNLQTLRPGAASHPYEYELTLDGVAVFTFRNILLPDSTTNEPASHGYVNFSVYPRADLPLGTLIENGAAIYFDFNEPIITNTWFHTLGVPLVSALPDDPEKAGALRVSVQPHPVSESAWLRVDGAPADAEKEWLLFDARGSLLRRENFRGEQFLFEKGKLGAGLYFYRLQSADGRSGAGKLIIH
jgi:uncharacterized repeat protein (TIGR01451 family)